MRLYLTAAGVYAGTQQEAKADGKGWRLEEVPTDKQGLIAYLNVLKFDTMGETKAPDPVAEGYGGIDPHAPPQQPDRVTQAIAFEDGFEKMSLTLKLHFAALAMEAARDQLG